MPGRSFYIDLVSWGPAVNHDLVGSAIARRYMKVAQIIMVDCFDLFFFLSLAPPQAKQRVLGPWRYIKYTSMVGSLSAPIKKKSLETID